METFRRWLRRFSAPQQQSSQLVVYTTNLSSYVKGKGPYSYAFTRNGKHAVTISQSDAKLTFLPTNVLDQYFPQKQIFPIFKTKNRGSSNPMVVDLTDEFGVKGPFSYNFDNSNEYLFVAGVLDNKEQEEEEEGRGPIITLIFPMCGGGGGSGKIDKSVVMPIAYEIAEFVAFDNRTVLFVKRVNKSYWMKFICNVYHFDKEKNVLYHCVKNANIIFPFKVTGECQEIVILEMATFGVFKLSIRIASSPQTDEMLLLKTIYSDRDNKANTTNFDKVVNLKMVLTRHEGSSLNDDNLILVEKEGEFSDKVIKTFFSPDGNAVFALTTGSRSRLFRISLITSCFRTLDDFTIEEKNKDNSTTPSSPSPPTIRILWPIVAFVSNGHFRVVDVKKRKLLFSSDAKEIFYLQITPPRFRGSPTYRALVHNEVPKTTLY